MTAIGSLVFCNACGTLLDRSSGRGGSILTCRLCGAKCKDNSSHTVITKSKPSAFPSTLRSKLSKVQTLTSDDIQTESIIRQTCEVCGRTEMRWSAVQLRGADEGSTCFYSCDCGHKFTVNS